MKNYVVLKQDESQVVYAFMGLLENHDDEDSPRFIKELANHGYDCISNALAKCKIDPYFAMYVIELYKDKTKEFEEICDEEYKYIETKLSNIFMRYKRFVEAMNNAMGCNYYRVSEYNGYVHYTICVGTYGGLDISTFDEICAQNGVKYYNKQKIESLSNVFIIVIKSEKEDAFIRSCNRYHNRAIQLMFDSPISIFDKNIEYFLTRYMLQDWFAYHDTDERMRLIYIGSLNPFSKKYICIDLKDSPKFERNASKSRLSYKMKIAVNENCKYSICIVTIPKWKTDRYHDTLNMLKNDILLSGNNRDYLDFQKMIILLNK